MAGAIDQDGAGEAAAPLTGRFYEALHEAAQRMMARERRGHTLQPTAVVNEACLRLMKGGMPVAPREEQLAMK